MDARPTYRIIQNIPHYNDRDGISGWTRICVGTAHTKGWAFVVAAKFDGEGMDETSVEVHHRDGYRVFRDFGHKARVWAQQNEDEMGMVF